ncbi:MAG: UDP-glucose 4-epimerase GalE [Candidatus Pacebacteria bacterium CG10_big_fil_rev_8_21_14_0_10_56_10]|nr:MAG: UDP-glucose 4-epimerase GalE [Candidatus Pacebacteria bacterium CG10_big_fil_rev_8_21_14_0_10_56_10]
MTPTPIIVTGGAGFLGRQLCRRLAANGHQLKIIDLKPSPDYPTVIADVRDTERMRREVRDAELVFHLASLIEAGESVEKPARYIDYNIQGTVSVLEAMRYNQIRTLIFSSSAAVYGEPRRVPIKEDDVTLPINPYGVTKLAMEGLLSSYVSAYGFTGVALRYFNLYGPEEHHQPETHAIPRFIQQIYRGEEVTVWGNGQHRRDYVYISDVVAAHLLALEFTRRHHAEYHYFNLSTEQPASVLEIIGHLERIIGRSAQIKHFPGRPGDPLQLYADATKVRQAFEWQAATRLDEGLAATVRYFIHHWDDENTPGDTAGQHTP